MIDQLVCFKPNCGIWHIPLDQVEYLSTENGSDCIQIHLKNKKIHRATNVEFIQQ